MKPVKEKKPEKVESETFYRLKKLSKFEYTIEAAEVPVTVPRHEPVKRNLRGIVISRLNDLLEK